MKKLPEYLLVKVDTKSVGEVLRFLDAEEVAGFKAHGRWIGKPIAGYGTVRCSECGGVLLENNGRFSYCPYCGARMGGENDEID